MLLNNFMRLFMLLCFHYIILIIARDPLQFPKYFRFGASTSAYQIEGGWNEDGKAESIWDNFAHNKPQLIKDNLNGDISANSYHRFDKDLKAINELGLQIYQFSISWSRILPTADSIEPSQAGLNYYSDIINKLLLNNVEPMIIMHYFDLPQYLEELGGFTNLSLVENFENYANILFENFGDRVKYWITFNEPFYNCMYSYGFGMHPPLLEKYMTDGYNCIDTTIKAHGKAYRLYQEKYKEKFNGMISIALSSLFFYSSDKELVDSAMQHQLGIFTQPIYGDGSYPEVILKDITSIEQFDDEWKSIIKGSADFFSLSYYTSRLLYKNDSAVPNVFLGGLKQVEMSVESYWRKSPLEYLYSAPEGLEDLLKLIRDSYDNPPIIITGNGWPDTGELYDDRRIIYIEDHLEAILNAINAGCNVTAYSVRSLIDSFEWTEGYTVSFGLYAVNFNSSEQERIEKTSAKFYKKLIKTRSLI